MSYYVTRNPKTDEPTAWKYPKDCPNEWARVKEMRETPHSLAEGGNANKPPTYPTGIPMKGARL